MTKIPRVLKDYSESGAFHALVNLQSAIDDTVFLTKSGDLAVFLKVATLDAECLEPLAIDQITRRFNASLRTLDERYRLYQYLVKRDYGPIPHDPMVQTTVCEAVRDRVAQLGSHELYRVEIHYALIREGSRRKLGLRTVFDTRQTIVSLDADLEQRRSELMAKAHSFVAQLDDFLKVRILDKRDAFGFVRSLLNYSPHKVQGVNLSYDRYVDFQACGSTLECHRDHLRLDDHFIKVLTLKELPAQTHAHLFRGLQTLSSEFIAVTEWKRASSQAMRRRIQSKRRHFHNSKASLLNFLNSSGQTPKDMLIDDSAAALVNELGSCLEEIEVQGGFFGEFSLTIILFDEDEARLRRSVAECFKVFSAVDMQLTEERYNLLNAFLGALPGNDAFNLRRRWVSNSNYADLSFIFAPDLGEVRNVHLGTEYLAVFETEDSTPYFFNLHDGDVAHTLMLGATGSGKSYTLSFLVTHLQKFAPFTYIFDLGGSYGTVTRRFGGTYVRIGTDRDAWSINPFSLPLTPENLQFQTSFVRVLAESGGLAITSADDREIFEQVQNLYAVEPEQRRLLTLANILPRPLRQALGKWVRGGQYGFLFDNVEDNLTFARFQTFDFEGMANVPQLLEPLLFYILHRAQYSILDADLASTFKVFVIDEAWRFLSNPVIRLYVQEALKTWRKKNAAMILATQSADDLLRSELLPVVVESCATKLFLANPGMDQAAYCNAFHLSPTEAEKIALLIPKRQLLLKRTHLSKILNLDLERSRT